MKILLIVFLFFVPAFAYSQIQEPEINCDSAYTLKEMNACAEKGYQNADKQMNSLYALIMERLHPENSEQDEYYKKIETSLVIAQKKWLEYKDSYAEIWKVKYEGGSMMSIVYYNVMADLTRKQIEQLNNLYEELNY